MKVTEMNVRRIWYPSGDYENFMLLGCHQFIDEFLGHP
jgi:hypothetical protein